MFCHNCGNKVESDSKFCTACGTCLIDGINTENSAIHPTAPPVPSQQPNKSESDTIAIVGFVLAFLFPIVGLILCKMALNKKTAYSTLAKAGVIISIVEMIVVVISIIISVVVTVSAINSIPDYYYYY